MYGLIPITSVLDTTNFNVNSYLGVTAVYADGTRFMVGFVSHKDQDLTKNLQPGFYEYPSGTSLVSNLVCCSGGTNYVFERIVYHASFVSYLAVGTPITISGTRLSILNSTAYQNAIVWRLYTSTLGSCS